MLRNALVVGCGAALGATARLACTFLAGDTPPMVLLLTINIAGCLLLGAWDPGPFLGKGMLGGYTSFSAFALMVVREPPVAAGAYLAATVLGCVGAWLLTNTLRSLVSPESAA
ncbi:fluoride efflux transporter family protein [Corynebacterium sp. zg-331]|uniref:fluoride efflux transporter family protein n=1 Tax=unclassified Corynebacterium TaxID=2624378 RepID=UPI00128B814E|nr:MULTISPECIES: fluoride efflux transporter family protein [unclassified Corynebacterium]MBC3186938.1 fluoride efflux transporter family protein [Corynebacterium sp. zg-331]MPV53417.1 fluoride efflux transporter family protein [Corynebacterium sp. zg331]